MSIIMHMTLLAKYRERESVADDRSVELTLLEKSISASSAPWVLRPLWCTATFFFFWMGVNGSRGQSLGHVHASATTV